MKKPLLIDLDGVLRIGKNPAPGLGELLSFITSENIPACIISNSTLSNAEMIRKFFDENKIELNIPLMTAADAAYNYVKQNYKSADTYCSKPVKSMFEKFEAEENPEAVVIGDMGKDWNYDVLTEIFRKVFNGADLIAMQTNRYWQTPEEGYLLDVGPFVKAIEYAADKKAVLIGKPSPIYFQSALNILGFSDKTDFLMLGDDLETDIKGALDLGGKAILIYTGKTPHPLNENSILKPTYEALDLFEVMEILKKLP
jgi:HAD superfamily hydrolase (TIGR01458 family)